MSELQAASNIKSGVRVWKGWYDVKSSATLKLLYKRREYDNLPRGPKEFSHTFTFEFFPFFHFINIYIEQYDNTCLSFFSFFYHTSI